MSFNTNFALWPIKPFGAEENNDGQQQNNDGGNNQGGQQNSQQNNQQQNNNDDDENDPYKGLTAKELKRKLADEEAARQKAEKDANALRDKETKAERDKLDKEQRLEAELTDANDLVAKLRRSLAEQAVIGAIRDDARFEWHNPNVVAQQLNSEKVKVDDDGKISGIDKELHRIAKDESFAFLLKKDNTLENQGNGNGNNGNQGNGQQQNSGGGFQGQSGFQPGQGGGNNGSGTDFTDAELAKNYPMLASRL